ncbi:maltase 1-like [Chrysoperla carnea]|uniref:maltase 1-like n=1 Tax=Chrysoperla carnea TaxID=189513 RepID=UPI001D083B35|nr:maltase 1-like [Chrysoperla carnea]
MFFIKCLVVAVTLCSVTIDAKDWWENEVFYQIYPRSFMDSDGDGVGDLQGIKSKLQHIKDAGLNCTWLSPIFSSPMVDFGYDISDFRNIHHEFGTIKDFEELSAEAKRLGIKLILDFVPNHSSDKHEWFQLSANRTKGYEDYYVWVDAKGFDKDGKPIPPNNWNSNFGGSAWEWVESRKQFYLHQFAIQQPDLNYRNPKLVQEMKDIIVYWLDKGVAGFRIDAVPFLFEVEDLRDEPRSYDPKALPNEYAYLLHPYTNNLAETYDMVYQWRAVLDNYTKSTDNVTRIMMTEAYADIKQQVLYYGNDTTPGAHFTFNFLLITDLNTNSTAHDFMFTINKWLSYLPLEYTSNWVLGNHDNHRVGSRYGAQRIDGLNMLLMVLPGVGVTYYGDEIGMLDTFISWEQTVDPIGLNAGPDRYQLFTRDPERTPFQWDDSVNTGFSTSKNGTWLPVNENYKDLNLKNQKAASFSHFQLYQKLMVLRQEKTIRDGDLNVKALSDNVLTLTRTLTGHDSFVYVFNLGGEKENVNLEPYTELPSKLKVELTSVNASVSFGTTVSKSGFTVGPYEAYILSAQSLLSSSTSYLDTLFE